MWLGNAGSFTLSSASRRNSTLNTIRTFTAVRPYLQQIREFNLFCYILKHFLLQYLDLKALTRFLYQGFWNAKII